MDWISGSNRILSRDLDGCSVALMVVDGSDVQELPYHMFQDGAVSPDGQRFVLSAVEENTFWFMGADSTLIETVQVPDKERPGGGSPFGIAWSPDGAKLAYVDQFAVETARGLVDSGMKQIRVMDLEGRDLSYLSSRDAQNLSPVWSPDGDALVYIHGESEQLFDWESGDPSTWGSSLWIAQVETGQYSELVTSEGRACWSPTWLPDGSGVIFVSNRKGQSDVWLVNRDGSSLQQLTDQGNVVALDIF